jgi:hypothetical protein
MRIVVCLVVLISLSCLVEARGAQNTGSVSGVVQDPSGDIVSGALVELKSGGTVLQSTKTDGSGSFRFTRVPPGDYVAHVSYEGFEPADVAVSIGSQAAKPVRISLTVAGVHQQATVMADSGQISTDPSENKDSVSISGETLSNLPVFDQDYIGTMSRFLDSGAIGTSGVTLVVDGMEVNDLGVSASAIKEVKINNDPYSAEFARPGRGRIEVVTKPGSLEYHGTFNFLFRDSVFNARDPFALSRAPEQRRIYEGFFTGPLRDSKTTSFLISINRNEEDVQSVVFASTPAGIIDENIAAPARNLLVAGKISHKFSDTNDFSLRYSYQDRSVKNQGVGGITLPQAGTNYQFYEHEAQYNQQTVFSPKLINQFRFLVGHYYQPTVSVSPSERIVVQDAFVTGGAQADQLRTEYHFELTEILSYSSGKNTIKGGVNIPDWSRRGLDNNVNFGGSFFFSSLQDFTAGRPYLFTQQIGDPRLIFVEKVVAGFAQDDLRLRPDLMFSFGLRYDHQNYFHDNNNFAPRFSFAYSPGKSQKTVIRGGAGVFYDRTGPRPIQDLLQLNGVRLRQFVITNPGFPDPFANGQPLGAQPVSIVRLDPRVQIPYTVQYSVALERQLLKSSTLAVTYIGSRGIKRFRSRDLNAPLAPLFSTRPDPNVGVLRQIESSGRSMSESVEVSFRGKVTERFSGMALYRASWAYDNTSGITFYPANNYDLSGEWGRSDFDRRHRFELLGTLNPGKWLNLGLAVSLYSGAPYNLTTGLDMFNDGVANDRPPGVRRNSLQGPGYADLDLRWSRDFFLAKSKKEKGPMFSVGIDAFNVLNRVNFVTFVGNLSSPFFGQAVAAQPPRRLQLSARIKF